MVCFALVSRPIEKSHFAFTTQLATKRASSVRKTTAVTSTVAPDRSFLLYSLAVPWRYRRRSKANDASFTPDTIAPHSPSLFTQPHSFSLLSFSFDGSALIASHLWPAPARLPNHGIQALLVERAIFFHDYKANYAGSTRDTIALHSPSFLSHSHILLYCCPSALTVSPLLASHLWPAAAALCAPSRRIQAFLVERANISRVIAHKTAHNSKIPPMGGRLHSMDCWP